MNTESPFGPGHVWLDAVEQIREENTGNTLLKTVIYNDMMGKGEKLALRFFQPGGPEEVRKVDETAARVTEMLGVAPAYILQGCAYNYFVWERSNASESAACDFHAQAMEWLKEAPSYNLRSGFSTFLLGEVVDYYRDMTAAVEAAASRGDCVEITRHCCNAREYDRAVHTLVYDN